MNNNWSYVKEHIEEFPEYKSSIFKKGFLVTNAKMEFGNEFPYYGNWREEKLCDTAHLYLHKNQQAYVLNKDDITYFLIGHAYDPFGYEHDENKLLSNLADKSKGIFKDGIPYINDWTGLFVLGIINKEEFTICGDFECLRTAYYGIIDNNWYITSHEELLAIRNELNRIPYVTELENYRWYHLYGEALPGDVSHYYELKRLMANTYVEYKKNEFSINRFYPNSPIKMCETEDDFNEVIRKIAQAMSNNMDLVAKKWDKPSISATGGRDSKGTMSAAYHIKDKYIFFSYNSKSAEKVDCEAASKISEAASYEHSVYNIPLEKEIYPEYDLVKSILHINSNRCYFNHNDIMKRIYFKKLNNIRIEVKSWTSETGRAYYYQRYGVKHMQKKYTSRMINVMSNIYLFNPKLMYKIDKVYNEYFKRSKLKENLFNYDWSDLINVETNDCRWGSDVICCEHYFSNDVTISYNNRHIIDLMLSVKIEERMNDRTHIAFTDLLCPIINATSINVVNADHDKKRMWLDKIYYFISSYRPF